MRFGSCPKLLLVPCSFYRKTVWLSLCIYQPQATGAMVHVLMASPCWEDVDRAMVCLTVHLGARYLALIVWVFM